MKLHNRYRRAKKFKLDEDGEVVDKFSVGRKKRPIPSGWSYWDYKHGRGLHRLADAQKRFFASRVGKPWDNVYSEFIGRTKQEKDYVGYMMRDRIHRSVELNAVRNDEGEVGTISPYCRYGLSTLSAGEMYVDPDTKILCRMPVKRPEWKSRWSARPSNDYPGLLQKKVGDITYVRMEKEHKRRIAPGVFEYEKQYIWVKRWTTTCTMTRRVPIHVRNPQNTGWTVGGYELEHYQQTVHHKVLASKKAISKNKLNEVVDTN